MLSDKTVTTTIITKGKNRLHKCFYCSRTYKLKDNYEKHIGPCEFFHKSQLQSRDDFNLSVETLPSQREMFSLLKTLALKCSDLEKEVQQLKQTVNIRQKKQILEWLNTHRTTLYVTFTEWYSNIEITMEDLEKVFEYDLIDGIKKVLELRMGGLKIIPICGFSQKKNHLYIFDSIHNNTNEWKSLSNSDLDKMIFCISRKFMQKFVLWQRKNEELVTNSERLKDQEIMYMVKINGSKISDEKRNAEVKRWLFEKLEDNLDTLYEFV
jgi:hypothetical protein